MAKKKEFKLVTMTDIKVFLLFLLDNIGYPIDHSSLIEMVAENTDEIIIDYDECLRELADKEHILFVLNNINRLLFSISNCWNQC